MTPETESTLSNITSFQESMIQSSLSLTKYVEQISGLLNINDGFLKGISDSVKSIGIIGNMWANSMPNLQNLGNIQNNLTKSMSLFSNLNKSMGTFLSQTNNLSGFMKNVVVDIGSIANIEMNILGSVSHIGIKDHIISPSPMLDDQRDQLGELLYNLDPNLERKRQGAWEVLESGNSDSLSQCANSTVELLRKTITKIIPSNSKWKVELRTILSNKYGSKSLLPFVNVYVDWIEHTITFVEILINKIEGIKHSINFKHEEVVRMLLIATEGLILVLLNEPDDTMK